MVLWLRRLGARVTGLSLPPHTDPGLFALCVRGRATDTYGDIAEYGLVARTLADCEPEIVIHMAAQALVRLSYADPLGTCATNIMGTATFCRRASFLTLDATHARALLGWRPVLSFDDAVNWTADWYRGFWNGDDIGAVTRRQIDAFSERLHHLADDPVPLRGTA